MTPFNDVRFALLGGSIVDANALLRAYIWHCIAIPHHRFEFSWACISGAFERMVGYPVRRR